MKSVFYNTLLLASTVSAAPAIDISASANIEKRATNIDSTILNYALTLEYLEYAFYKQGLANFTEADFTKAGYTGHNFYRKLQMIAKDEQYHVLVLQALMDAAGYVPTEACTYTFPVKTASEFVDLASTLEGVGVSAYLGAAAQITDKNYVTAAGSIVTIEARHSAFLRNAKTQYDFPQQFDTPLDFDEVYTLASQFIKFCPSSNPSLGVKAFPKMTTVTTGLQEQGATVKFKLPSTFIFPSGTLYIAFPLVTGPIWKEVTVDKTAKTVSCQIPNTSSIGPNGQVYAILTSSNSAITDSTTLAGPAIVPVLATL